MFGELRLLAIAAAVLGLYFGARWKLHEARQEGRAACQAEYAAAALKAAQENAATLIRKTEANNAIAEDLVQRQAALAAAAARERATADSLRSQLAAIGSEAAASTPAAVGANAERVGVLAGLLAEGVGLVAEGSERVGRLAAQVEGLQRHERDVCLAP